MHDEARARRELAGEFAVDLGDVDQRGSLERSRARDLHGLAVNGRLDVAFDDEHVAVGNVDAAQLDVDANGKLAHWNVGARLHRCALQRGLGRQHRRLLRSRFMGFRRSRRWRDAGRWRRGHATRCCGRIVERGLESGLVDALSFRKSITATEIQHNDSLHVREDS